MMRRHVSCSVPLAAARFASGEPQSDWLTRVQREMVQESDPLGGQFHKDYFRDPSLGYSPVFAPRNFEDGGVVDYTHALSSTRFATSFRDRDTTSHEAELSLREARESRKAVRSSSHEHESKVLSGRVSTHSNGHGDISSLVGTFHSVVREGLPQHKIGNLNPRFSNLHAGIDKNEIAQSIQQQGRYRQDEQIEEGLRTVQGFRQKEQFEFEVKQRNERIPFRGYDMDRFLAGQQGSLHTNSPFSSNLVAPGTSTEAQQAVRQNSVTERESRLAQSLLNNTVAASPKIGESLTEDIADSLQGIRVARDANEEQQRNARFGLGRQGPLVQDGGPDKRTLKKNKNDERLIKAMIFRSNAYRKTPTDEHIDPVERNRTSEGMGHLFRNKFDIDRRISNFASSKADPTERATHHYGRPVLEEQDLFVLRHRNAKGDRTIEYFQPFPGFKDFRLQRAYRDVEGFPLLKPRSEFLEWELFLRYRAHFEQRRHLALVHGLEPKSNETIEERNQRRFLLDRLCEQTPFDASKLNARIDDLQVDSQTLRSWFGFYFLPSPTIVETVLSNQDLGVNLFVLPKKDLDTVDQREHILSSRYLNAIFTNESYQFRIGRGTLKELVGRIPEADVAFKQPQSILRHFSPEERQVYDKYVEHQISLHTAKYESKKRFIPNCQQFGQIVNHRVPTEVFDAQRISDGVTVIIGSEANHDAIAAALVDSNRALWLQKEEHRLLEHSRRKAVLVDVRLDDGSVVTMDECEFNKCEREFNVDIHNVALNFGSSNYDYNRNNYVETQDKIWEENTTAKTEGWSPTTHADGLQSGLPVLARRKLSSNQVGEPERGVIVEYLKQPFFNPEPRTVTIQFLDCAIEPIPLKDCLIWQRQYYGPERTVGDETRKLNSFGRRFINVADPKNEKKQTSTHFLDKYQSHSPDAIAENLKSLKNVNEIDQWSLKHDSSRAENYRPLTINNRKDFIRGGYFHRYTPWDWITLQESDQPMLWSQLRTDDIGPAYYHYQNRYWRFKARPHGYIRNFENEVRDLFQYVDGVTPWAKARKIRTFWESREHHPIPQFNRPEVAIHRNSVGLLPSHMWETDKKTGKVKVIKDSVRDYQTQTPVPAWSQL